MEAVELYPEAAKMPVFWATITAEEKIVVNQGGTSSGKSHAIIRVLFFYAFYYPKIKIEVVGGTLPKLIGDTMEIAEEIALENPHLKASINRYNMQNRTYYFNNGSKILFKSYEKAKDAEGPKRDILYISEARNLQWATAYQLIKRSKKKIFIDYNPVATFWCMDKIINCPFGRNGTKEFNSVKVIRSWHIHNNFIDQDLHDSIENIADKEMWKAYARGLTAKVSGLVYPDWRKVESFPPTEDVVWGIDFGYTQDPTGIVKCAINKTLNGITYDYVFEEISYSTGIPPGMIHQLLINAGYKFGQPVYIDHDSSMQRELRALRIVAVKAVKGDVLPGILHLRSKKVAYTAKSENIEMEIRRYSFMTKEDGANSNQPEDRFNHLMDACRYASFSHAVRTGLIKGYKEEPGSNQ